MRKSIFQAGKKTIKFTCLQSNMFLHRTSSFSAPTGGRGLSRAVLWYRPSWCAQECCKCGRGTVQDTNRMTAAAASHWPWSSFLIKQEQVTSVAGLLPKIRRGPKWCPGAALSSSNHSPSLVTEPAAASPIWFCLPISSPTLKRQNSPVFSAHR